MPIFNKAVIEIVKKQPLVFLKSRMEAFIRAGCSYDYYNLILPFMILIILIIYVRIKHNWLYLLICPGVFGHTCITTLTMPAFYFKYFFEMYVFAYIFGVITLIEVIQSLEAGKTGQKGDAIEEFDITSR